MDGAARLIEIRGSLRLDTRAANPIENYFDRSPPFQGSFDRCRDWKLRFPEVLHRSTEPTAMYNCHGLTFASRRTGITRPGQIRTILKDDEYQPVKNKDLEIGDIAIYVDQSGDIFHSGIIVRLQELHGIKVPWVLSKWGDGHEAVHKLRDCPYDPSIIEYYRIVK
jgi:hypothetical protein